MNEPQPNQGDETFVRLEWHPVIRAFFWVISWSIFSLAAAINWEFFTVWTLARQAVTARAIWIGAALVCLTVVVLLLDLAGGFAQRIWDEYPGAEKASARRKLYAGAFGVFLALTLPYLWFVHWLLGWIDPTISTFVALLDGSQSQQTTDPVSWRDWLLGLIATGGLIWAVAATYRRNPIYSYDGALRILGLKKLLGGIALMSYLRTLAPRGDLFLQGPFISWIICAAFIIILHESIPIPIFAWLIPALLMMIFIPYLIAQIAPPVWLFLGTSGYASSVTFFNLRNRWRCHGVTLLDRVHPGAIKFYYQWRSRAGRSPIPPNPSIGRVWSVRTRHGVWQTAFRLLATYVPVIVVDFREGTDIVDFEMDWLTTRGLLYKTYVLAESGQSISNAKVVDEEALLEARLGNRGLELA